MENVEANDNFETDLVSISNVTGLLAHFSQKIYTPAVDDAYAERVMTKCIELFKSDYNVTTVENKNGCMSYYYPAHLALPMNERENTINSTIYESFLDEVRYTSLADRARLGRCRTRFPVPVILYKGKYVCRSATISGGPEILGRVTSEMVFNFYSDNRDNEELDDGEHYMNPNEWPLFSKVRSDDIKLLKLMNVGTIVDFMVEKRKVKFNCYVSSSEKVDMENQNRYSDFKLISLPYPGCEFFKDYRRNSYVAEGITFDWNQSFCDAAINVPNDPHILNQLNIDWAQYKNWDLKTITTNYLKLILKHLHEGNDGILVHCISGWDRTPLFISLLRLSLWADGVIHQSLDAQQILYLTIAYDWMLFGHQLCNRLAKEEEIFFFCFNMLKYIVGEEFSMCQPKPRSILERLEKGNSDSESLFDVFMRDAIVTNGDEISLNSTSSQETRSISEDSPSTNNQNIDNGNVAEPTSSPLRSPKLSKSPPSKQTSPVSVPASKSRQRHDSSSSLNSWKIVSSTGSIRGSETSDTILNANIMDFGDSTTTIVEDSVTSYQTEECVDRKLRLLKVRELFLTSYHATIGFEFIGGEPTLMAKLESMGRYVVKTAGSLFPQQ